MDTDYRTLYAGHRKQEVVKCATAPNKVSNTDNVLSLAAGSRH